MDYKNKATIEKKKWTKGIAVMIFLGCVGVAALGFLIYNIINFSPVYALIYLIAFVLSTMYTAMKLNTIMPTYLADDDEKIHMCSWENDFFPFRVDKGVLGEFIPEKTKNVDILQSDIKSILIGTGNFISRILPESNFSMQYKEYKKKFHGALKRAEFIHITLEDGSEEYMPVTDYDTDCLADIVRDVQRNNKNMQFTTGNRRVRKGIPANNMRFN